MKRILKIEFENEEDYTQFVDGLTLKDREFTEIKGEINQRIKDWLKQQSDEAYEFLIEEELISEGTNEDRLEFDSKIEFVNDVNEALGEPDILYENYLDDVMEDKPK